MIFPSYRHGHFSTDPGDTKKRRDLADTLVKLHLYDLYISLSLEVIIGDILFKCLCIEIFDNFFIG